VLVLGKESIEIDIVIGAVAVVAIASCVAKNGSSWRELGAIVLFHVEMDRRGGRSRVNAANLFCCAGRRVVLKKR